MTAPIVVSSTIHSKLHRDLPALQSVLAPHLSWTQIGPASSDPIGIVGVAEEAARLVQDLLLEDWLERFGADGYLALNDLGLAAPAGFAQKIGAHLRKAACWPTQQFSSTKTLAKASDIVIPDGPLLDGLLTKDRYLDQRLSANRVATDLAVRNGAKPFTLNSLVRLRCAGEDVDKLYTKLSEKEADYHFTNYEVVLRDERWQQQMANAITKLSRRLSNQNRKDLRETTSTLAADGSLRPASTLVRVDEGLLGGLSRTLSLAPPSGASQL